MKNTQEMQRMGAYAALMEGLLLVVGMAMFAVVLPSQGFLPSDFTDFSKVAPIIPSFNVINVIAVLRSVVFLTVILAVSDRIQAVAPNRMRLAVFGASVVSTLLLAQGMLNIIGWPILLQNPSAATTAGVAFQAVSQSLIDSAQFVEGWVALLFGWAALASKTFSAPFSIIVMLSGVLALLVPLSGIVVVFAIPLWIIWNFWLGIVLLRGAPLRNTTSTAEA